MIVSSSVRAPVRQPDIRNREMPYKMSPGLVGVQYQPRLLELGCADGEVSQAVGIEKGHIDTHARQQGWGQVDREWRVVGAASHNLGIVPMGRSVFQSKRHAGRRVSHADAVQLDSIIVAVDPRGA
jgi:hypothetical protein